MAVEELRFGDNDQLSAEVAMLAKADLLVLLTSVAGLLDDDGQTVPVVRDLAEVAGWCARRKAGSRSADEFEAAGREDRGRRGHRDVDRQRTQARPDRRRGRGRRRERTSAK